MTVGTELPFDRLVLAVDRWAVSAGRAADVFAQTGDTKHPPVHIRWAPFLDPQVVGLLFGSVDLIVAHAGMGTILTALGDARPLVIMPRRSDLGEHRNDHQLSTARHLSNRHLVQVAGDETRLTDLLDGMNERPIEAPPPIGPFAQPTLIHAVHAAIIGAQDAHAPS